MRPRAIAALALALAAPGCGFDVPTGVVGEKAGTVVDIPPVLPNTLDLLFVVDNSSDMRDLQLKLGASFDPIIAHLGLARRGLPDLHVGVASTDLGANEFAAGVPSCSEDGEDGRLQVGDCGMVDSTFLEQSIVDGKPEKNFSGTLTERFQCMAQLGANGCDYEQPLQSMQRALSKWHADQNFVRAGGTLAVVFLTNEDDCSVIDDGLFDPARPEFNHASPNSRCFQQGVQCSGQDDVGTRQGCEPNQNSAYVAPTDDFTTFLRDLKPPTNPMWDAKFDDEDKRLVVASIMGDSALVEVALDVDDNPLVVPQCADRDGGSAPIYPAVRLRSFVDEFRGSEVDSLCSPRGQTPFTARIARQLRRAVGTACLSGPLLDANPTTVEIEPSCEVYRIKPGRESVSADGVREDLPQCDANVPPQEAVLPCYRIVQSTQCATFESQLELEVYDEHGRLSGGSERAIGFEGNRVRADCYLNP